MSITRQYDRRRRRLQRIYADSAHDIGIRNNDITFTDPLRMAPESGSMQLSGRSTADITGNTVAGPLSSTGGNTYLVAVRLNARPSQFDGVTVALMPRAGPQLAAVHPALPRELPATDHLCRQQMERCTDCGRRPATRSMSHIRPVAGSASGSPGFNRVTPQRRPDRRRRGCCFGTAISGRG